MFRFTVTLLLTLCISRPASCVTQGEITVFFTGDELGQLKPCGCSGGQLGGIDRRFSVLNSIPAQNRLIFDTGSLVSESTTQNLIKFNIVVQAFGLLGYDVVNLSQQDIQIAEQTGSFEVMAQLFRCITAAETDVASLLAKFAKKFSIDEKTLVVTVAAANTDEQLASLDNLFASDGNAIPVNILIINRSESAVISDVSKNKSVDCLIIPSQFEEPTLINDPNDRPLVISVGRLGKYVGKIQITLQNDKPHLVFSHIAITEKLPQNQQLVELYKDYQRIVKEAGLVEKYPRFVLPDNLEYVGSKSCKLCHDYEYEKWMKSQQVFIPGLETQASKDSYHAGAFATLEKVGSDFDPECVVCHVIGMQYQTGYISPEKTPEMKDVGCENCHGPGSEHVRSLCAAETAGPISTCTDCHTIEHSANYANNEKQYNEKTIHWRTPVSRIRVSLSEPNKTR